MVLPPNRIGGTRGPNGSTLDDIVAAIQETNIILGEQAVVLESMRSFLDSIAQALDPTVNTILERLSYLTGSAAPAEGFGTEGLPGYLSLVNGSRAEATDWGQSAFLTLTDLQFQFSRLYQMAHGGGPFISGGVNQWKRAGDLLEALSLVTGLATDDPNGSTLKDLLRSIDVNQARAADCCEENGNQEPPTETQPPGPEDSCPLSGGPLRTTGYFFWRNLPAEELDEYIPLWDGLEAASGGLVAPLNSFDAAPIPAIYAPEFLANVCFEWNLLDGQVPGQLAQYRSSSTGEFVGETPTLISVTIGGGSSSVYLLDPEDRPRVFTVRVAEGSGAPPHNNYWLRWQVEPV